MFEFDEARIKTSVEANDEAKNNEQDESDPFVGPETILHGGAKATGAAYQHEITPSQWIMSNHASFLEWMNQTYTYVKGDQPDTDTCRLFDHQRFIKDYMQIESPYRGVLLYHGLGVGKTRASIAVAESLRPNVKKVVVMVPASLRQNYINEIIQCGHREFAKDQYWKPLEINVKDEDAVKAAAETYGVSESFIRKFGRVWRVSTKSRNSNWDDLQDFWPEIMTFITANVLRKYTFINYNGLRRDMVSSMDKDYFNNAVVIVDEAHNFISRVVNGQVVNGKIIGRKVLTPIYQMLMDAKNLKLVMLSGTPLINRPIELGYTLNLLRGYIHAYDLHYRSTREFRLDAVQEALNVHPILDMATVDAGHKRIRIALVPDGFTIDREHKFMTRLSQDVKYGLDTVTRLEALKAELAPMGVDVVQVFPRKFTALPVDESRFDELFVNYETTNADDAIKNIMLFTRRIVGLVSYFEAYDPKDYPRLDSTEIVEVPFSNVHFKRYMEMRDVEAEKELKNKNTKRMQRKSANANAAKDQLTTNSTYRSFSRALCNFCFPEEISRPFPRDIRQMLKEQDDGVNEFANAQITEADLEDDDTNNNVDEDENEKEIEKEKEKDKDKEEKQAPTYEKAIAKAIKKLRQKRDTFLTGKNLQLYGPKFHELMMRLNKSPGSALIYSQFRTVEGAAIMSLVLEAHGYAELKVGRKANGDLDVHWDPEWEYNEDRPFFVTFVGSAKEETQLLMDLFNSNWDAVPAHILSKLKDAGVKTTTSVKEKKGRNLYGQVIKAMIITQSGSEGISLRNVRQVHILEPYWNEIRIKQVIGRAVRARSHEELPEKDRNVKVYQYMSVFTDKQLKVPMVDTREARKTSDEYIHDIATRKGFINNSLLHILKNAAIDCRINLATHENTQPNKKSDRKIQCFKLPEGYQRLAFIYGDIADEETDDTMSKRTEVELVPSVQKFVTIYVDVELTEDKTLYHAFPYDMENNFVYDRVDFERGYLRVIGRVDEKLKKVVFMG